MDQKATFLDSEGDAFFRRNRGALASYHIDAMREPTADPVLAVLDRLRPKRVLEVGCANGWKLDVIRHVCGAEVAGVEPSREAIAAGFPDIDLRVGTADALPFDAASFDCVIYGFCLYLCDRADLPQIVAEGDRVLKPGGRLLVYDFAPTVEYTRAYHHLAGVTSFKRDHAELWRVLGYEQIEREDLADEVAVSVLRKP